jgi:uncharacterized protein YbaR (Trm112 family)
MHLEVVGSLRCPAGHDTTWLVARTDRLDARHIMEGVLGCPICGAEYRIERGTARLGPPVRGEDEPIPDAAIRAAALLDLTTPQGLVLLAGAWAAAAVEIAALVEQIHILALDAPDESPPPGLGVSSVEAGHSIPLASGSARGIALDAAHASASMVAQAAESLRAGGRLLAPAGVAVPSALVELARDDRWWVAERRPQPSIVSLAAGRRRDDDR